MKLHIEARGKSVKAILALEQRYYSHTRIEADFPFFLIYTHSAPLAAEQRKRPPQQRRHYFARRFESQIRLPTKFYHYNTAHAITM